jgi:hypothetical protein
MSKDDVGNFDIALVEDLIAAPFNILKAAGVGDREVSANGCATVVLIADHVVVATAAVKISLHGIPFCSDVNFNAISM